MEIKYTAEDIEDAINTERNKILAIIFYILNKNSYSINEGGVDYKKLCEDLEDLKQHLEESIF